MFVFYDAGPPTITQGPRRDIFYPSRDSRVMASLEATKDAMAAAGKVYDPLVYDGAEHAYMRVGEDPADSNPADAVAVKKSLARLDTLLRRNLK